MFLLLLKQKHLFKLKRNIRSMALHVTTEDTKAVSLAVELLKTKQIVAVPTDTVYGLACSVTDVDCINKLYTIKGRLENKPLAICLGQVCDIKNWAQVSHLPKQLLYSLLPGPVTIVLNCTAKLEKSLLLSDKVGIRIPNYTFIQSVVNKLESPLALTSANLSGEQSSIDINEFKPLWSKLAAVFDGGILCKDENNRSASTVVDLSTPGFYKLIRPGIIPKETCSILETFGVKPFA